MSVFWIKQRRVRLGIMPRPRGGNWLGDDLRLLQSGGVDVLVSALTTEEAEELRLNKEAQECSKLGLTFISFPIEDRSLPSDRSKFDSLMDQLLAPAAIGKAVAVHCRAGIGRSSLIAACLLVNIGLSPGDAFCLIEESRCCPVPDTLEQRQWVERYSDPLQLR